MRSEEVWGGVRRVGSGLELKAHTSSPNHGISREDGTAGFVRVTWDISVERRGGRPAGPAS